MFGERPGVREEKEPAGHAQVCDEDSAVIQAREDVLAAPLDLFKPRAAQEPCELARRVLGREPRPDEFGCFDAQAGDEAVERARDEFDFG